MWVRSLMMIEKKNELVNLSERHKLLIGINKNKIMITSKKNILENIYFSTKF
jgi:hypothetical protein